MRLNDSSYTLVKTGDGSYTLHLKAYDEHMHSLSGAYEEALLKHVLPSGILNCGRDSLRVLDVGFGLGYNILALLVELRRIGHPGRLTVISIENDRSLLPALRSIRFDDERDEIYAGIRDAYAGGPTQAGNGTISVRFGDGRKIISSLDDDFFDAVFFDPFSPSRNPELWTEDIFRHVYRMMNRDAVLTTYSSAPQVRAALLSAGFIIGRGPSVGGKREGTLAAKTEIIRPIPDLDREELLGSIRAVPYRDPCLSAARDLILNGRIEEMKRLRSEKKTS